MIKSQLALGLLTGVIAFGGMVAPASCQSFEARLNRIITTSEPMAVRTAADTRLTEGQRLAQSGNITGAISLWQESLFLYDYLKDLQGLTQTYEYLGLNYVQLNQWAEAEHAFRQQLAIARTREDFQSQIYVLNNLGMMLLQNLNLEGAQDTIAQALAIAENTGNLRGKGLSLSNLGLVTYYQGNYGQAIEQYQTALNLRQQINDREGLTNTYNNLGDAYLANKDYRDAIQFYRLGKVNAEDLGDSRNIYRSLEGLSQSYFALGEYSSSSLRFLRQWLEQARTNNNLFEQLTALSLGGDYYQALGDMANAIYVYQQALTIAETIDDKTQAALLANKIAQIASIYPQFISR